MSTTQNPTSVQPADFDRVDQHTARRPAIPRSMAGGPTLLPSQSPSPSAVG